MLPKSASNGIMTQKRDEREKTASAGATLLVIEATMSPLDVMEKIWDKTIIDLIVEQTNVYAQKILEQELKDQSRIKRWKPVTFEDVWNFFVVLILQSLDPRPIDSDYWYSNVPYLQMPAFTKVMPYKKYVLMKIL